MPEVSVVIPVYNVEKYLERCLNSVLAQTYSDYEIICINDCSQDRSGMILEKYMNEYPGKIKIQNNNKNLGLGITRNIGMKMAVGKYIMFIDSDDYIKPDYIQRYVECMKLNDIDLVVGGFIKVRDSSEVIHAVNNSIWSILTYVIACGKMYKKEFLTKNNLQFGDYKCGEDIHFNVSAFCCGISYHVITYEGYYYVDNNTSITQTMNYKKCHEKIVMNIFDDVLDKYNNYLTVDQREIIAYVCYVNLLNSLLQFNRRCGIRIMQDKYNLCNRYMEMKFPEYMNNKYLRIGHPYDQTAKIKFATGVLMTLKRVHLDKAVYYLISLL